TLCARHRLVQSRSRLVLPIQLVARVNATRLVRCRARRRASLPAAKHFQEMYWHPDEAAQTAQRCCAIRQRLSWLRLSRFFRPATFFVFAQHRLDPATIARRRPALRLLERSFPSEPTGVRSLVACTGRRFRPVLPRQAVRSPRVDQTFVCRCLPWQLSGVGNPRMIRYLYMSKVAFSRVARSDSNGQILVSGRQQCLYRAIIDTSVADSVARQFSP